MNREMNNMVINSPLQIEMLDNNGEISAYFGDSKTWFLVFPLKRSSGLAKTIVSSAHAHIFVKMQQY